MEQNFVLGVRKKSEFNAKNIRCQDCRVKQNSPPPPPPEGRVTPLCGPYWGVLLDRARFFVSAPKHGI